MKQSSKMPLEIKFENDTDFKVHIFDIQSILVPNLYVNVQLSAV